MKLSQLLVLCGGGISALILLGYFNGNRDLATASIAMGAASVCLLWAWVAHEDGN